LTNNYINCRFQYIYEVIGRYERDEVKPSIEMAAAIADALEVSLDYLVGNTDLLLDKSIIKRIQDIQLLAGEDKGHLLPLWMLFLGMLKLNKHTPINIAIQ
jgi:transcriptional regulator with XRE-family HTH domain